MDHPAKERAEVAELIARIRRSRVGLGSQVIELKRKLDVPARVRSSLMDKPAAWFGGSLGAGFLLSKVVARRRKRKEGKSRGIFGLLAGSAIALAKPSLKTMITNEVVRRLKSRYAPTPPVAGTQLQLPKT